MGKEGGARKNEGKGKGIKRGRKGV